MALNIKLFTITIMLVVWMVYYDGVVHGQVTFSRDWNPGKRIVENPEFRNALKSASTICHLLINQIRQTAACENRDDMDVTTVFTGNR